MKLVTREKAFDDGFLHLAAVMDFYSRQIGMAMADHLRTDLVESALHMALAQRRPPHHLLHHSDRGSQYTSLDYQVERFSYIMCFYNHQRRHSILGYLSPCIFESQSERLSFTPLN